MMKQFLVLLLVVLSTMGFSQDRPEIHCKHFFKGYPFGTPISNDLIIRDIYALSNNDQTKFADWVAYRLTMHEVEGDLDVKRKWKEDPWLAENETLEPSPASKEDYRGANKGIGVDRGHQAPLASFKGSRFASQSNMLSNITPQKKDMNQGCWKNLEEAVRGLVRTGKTVYVMTGPLYNRNMPSLPNADEAHIVPSGYWKVVVCITSSKSYEVAAFLMDQESVRTDKVLSKLVTVNQVEKLSGLDLLWELPDSEESQIEAEKNSNWASTWVK
jgi:endonuclease G